MLPKKDQVEKVAEWLRQLRHIKAITRTPDNWWIIEDESRANPHFTAKELIGYATVLDCPASILEGDK